MLLGFKTELKLNNIQKTLLLRRSGTARHAWNWGLGLTLSILGHNKANPQDKIKFPTAIDLHKWLVTLVKPDNPWYYECSKCVGQYALKNLRLAWDRCFKKVSKTPKFKKKGRNDSFTLDGTLKIVDHFKIQLPRIGVVRTYERLPFGYKPKSVTISKHANKWFISWKIEVDTQSQKEDLPEVGVDLGIKNLATLSSGEIIKGSYAYKKHEDKLKRLQRFNRHKILGSNNWKKAQLKIARLHRYIANIRKDTLHKLTTYLAKNHSVIVIENLNVSGMLSNRKLSKSISDMGFYEFRRQLEYKTNLYGSKLEIVNQWFPSSKLCSQCGNKKEMLELSERTYKCDSCNMFLDRDLNAALNLRNYIFKKA